MVIKKQLDIRSSEITDQNLYLARREFLHGVSITALAILGAAAADIGPLLAAQSRGPKLTNIRKGPFGTDEALTPYDDVTTYNNFYEFGTDKADPSRSSKSLTTRPWTIAVEGAVNKPGVYNLEDILKPHALEERVYRLRCVEAWSMVIPWIGFPLKDLITRFEPTSRAKYVEFTTLHNPAQMPGQRRQVLQWPYVEGLRLDEALHPLTILAAGLYGEVLPNQNGAPLRLIVPSKYGFKSIKSIVRMRFVDQQPTTSWMKSAPGEYGFYSNVNPEVSHPRWSQARERRIGELFKQKTQMFNGYAEQVAHLYAGMDLRKYY